MTIWAYSYNRSGQIELGTFKYIFKINTNLILTMNEYIRCSIEATEQ